jgi:hypothetical protein
LGAGDVTPAGLWLAVIASGVYHGFNPGMGWPLAVSAGLMERSSRALAVALGYLAVGHLLAMLVALLPFALLATLIQWQREIEIVSSCLVAAFGVLLLVRSRHPRLLARIPPTQLALWSFAIAIAHGAGLMLVPIYLGMCRVGASVDGPAAAGTLIGTNLGVAVVVSVAHATAMLVAGGVAAWAVYRYLGLRALSRGWLNLEAVWASSLILVGGLSLAGRLASGG